MLRNSASFFMVYKVILTKSLIPVMLFSLCSHHVLAFLVEDAQGTDPVQKGTLIAFALVYWGHVMPGPMIIGAF